MRPLALVLTLVACAVEPVAPTSEEAVASASAGEPVFAPAASHAPAASEDPILADLRDDPLAYTRHGRCRMECRRISEDEVRAVLATGRVAPERSRDDGACPSHAVEGVGDDGHRLRIVFAACERETRVVTAIDLDQDWDCSCD